MDAGRKALHEHLAQAAVLTLHQRRGLPSGLESIEFVVPPPKDSPAAEALVEFFGDHELRVSTVALRWRREIS